MKKLLFKFSLLFLVLFLCALSKPKAQTNQYLDFDGVDDWVSVPNASQLIANSTAFSITGWFFDNALGYGQGMMGFRSATQGFYMIQLNNGTIECRFINAANTLYEVVAPASTTIPNMWQHYAWIYDGSAIKLYLNGNLVGSKAATGSFTSTTVAFGIGRSFLSSLPFYYNGRIDEVSIWNKALNSTEILDMMQNELTGTETGLQLYYKFNQGVPAGNNASITKLHTELNSPLYDGDILAFSLTGANSNFNGTLNTSFQAISFPQIPVKLISSPPFKLTATATSGLTVEYALISGPATISNDTVTLTGAGTVKIKAFQNGNAQIDTATPVINTFDVVDPSVNAPIIEPRHPLAGNVYMPVLAKIQLAANATIIYPSLFSVQELHFKINGQTIAAHDFGNGHYTAWWQPPTYGNYAIEILSTSNLGAVGSVFVNVNILPTAVDTIVQAFSGVLINSSSAASVIVEGQLPSFIGAYDTIIATLTVTCPSGGCGEWDHIASVEAKSKEGNWFELIRYITPYGTACSHKLLVTDYESVLKGKVAFRVSCGTMDNGYLYALKFDYKQGTPAHLYSQINQVWRKTYPFGDYANLQPVSDFNYTFPANVLASKIKLVSTGHGWGTLNSNNAAEFYDATHHIYVNNVNTYTQHNWTNCNPNPDNCMPQNGTWQYSRAGWCPGSIARPFDYDLTPFVATNSIALKYVFYEQYIDQCHPNNPNCVTGSTCTDCNDGFNPQLDVACHIVNFFDAPPPNPEILEITELINKYAIEVYPNPSNGIFNISSDNKLDKVSTVEIYNLMGNAVMKFQWKGENTAFNLSNLAKGIYIMKISNKDVLAVKKLILR